jgi:methylenetetrahydrofolate reductase (NADPH)
MILAFELVPTDAAAPDGAAAPGWDELLALGPDLLFVAEPPGLDNDAAIDALRRRGDGALVPHLTTRNRRAEDVAERVGRWRGLGVERVLALRGDAVTACDLSRDQRLRSGRELIELLVALDPELEVWCAAYPEVHPEAASADADLRTLLAKQDAGAAAAVCQFSFEAEPFLRFRDRARAAGVALPLLAGVLAPTLGRLPFARRCGATIPRGVEEAATRYAGDPAAFADWGVEQALMLATRLSDEDADGLQVFTGNDPAAARAIAALR